jgi:hypothetical protein
LLDGDVGRGLQLGYVVPWVAREALSNAGC